MPEGYKYWIQKDNNFFISDKAPDWAKKEFEEYQKELEIKKDEYGNVIYK